MVPPSESVVPGLTHEEMATMAPGQYLHSRVLDHLLSMLVPTDNCAVLGTACMNLLRTDGDGTRWFRGPTETVKRRSSLPELSAQSRVVTIYNQDQAGVPQRGQGISLLSGHWMPLAAIRGKKEVRQSCTLGSRGDKADLDIFMKFASGGSPQGWVHQHVGIAAGLPLGVEVECGPRAFFDLMFEVQGQPSGVPDFEPLRILLARLSPTSIRRFLAAVILEGRLPLLWSPRLDTTPVRCKSRREMDGRTGARPPEDSRCTNTSKQSPSTNRVFPVKRAPNSAMRNKRRRKNVQRLRKERKQQVADAAGAAKITCTQFKLD